MLAARLAGFAVSRDQLARPAAEKLRSRTAGSQAIAKLLHLPPCRFLRQRRFVEVRPPIDRCVLLAPDFLRENLCGHSAKNCAQCRARVQRCHARCSQPHQISLLLLRAVDFPPPRAISPHRVTPSVDNAHSFAREASSSSSGGSLRVGLFTAAVGIAARRACSAPASPAGSAPVILNGILLFDDFSESWLRGTQGREIWQRLECLHFQVQSIAFRKF
jgi:hypothetical protein